MNKKLRQIQEDITELKRQERNLNIVDVLQSLLDVVQDIDKRVDKKSRQKTVGENDGTYF